MRYNRKLLCKVRKVVGFLFVNIWKVGLEQSQGEESAFGVKPYIVQKNLVLG